ncbi:MAG TPA: hypothetical protein VHG29_05215 [Novosphingobium sp.]|nr:hypothetical protein [Novosphingobium sp.]
MSVAEPETPDAKPRVFAFRKRYNAPKLSADEAKRQGEITQLAFLTLGGRDGALAFLNQPHAELAGRPIDLAIADADGFARVRLALEARSAAA